MDKLTEFALLFKARDNVQVFETTTATLISKNPIVLRLADKLFLSKEYSNLILTETIYTKIQDSSVGLNSEILVVPIADGEMWYAIDKVRRL